MEINSRSKKLGIFSVVMVSVAGIFSIRSLSVMAEYGFTLITYYLFAAIIYFVPSALICAELATGWPKTGGLYVWVREAFGPRLGFLAIWLEWTNTVVSFPAILSFGAITFTYITFPNLMNHKLVIVSLMLFIFWGATIINLLGIRKSLRVSGISTFAGIVIPASVFAILGLVWLLVGKPIQIDLSLKHLIPDLHWDNAAFLAGLVLSYAGMQIAGFHAQDIENPQRNFPKAILISALIILVASILGALAVAMVIPQKDISLVGGLMQLVEKFFITFHLHWLATFIGILILIGFFANLDVWLIGPSRGLFICAQYGDLPRWLQKTNKRGVPTNVLLLQAFIGSVFALAFLLFPNFSASFWLLTVLTAQLTFLMNLLLFGAVIRLRYTQPDVVRNYKIPGGKFGVWLIAGIPMLAVLSAFIVGFFPPIQLETGNPLYYHAFLVTGILLFVLPALFIQKKPA